MNSAMPPFPFPFDVHALFFADDAVAVENELHKAFAKGASQPCE